MMRFFLALLAAVAISGCASTPPITSTPELAVTRDTALPAPQRADLLQSSRPYLIGPFDKLTVDVFGVEEMSGRKIQTDASGRISLPLVGTVEAAGKTPGELAQALADRLRGRYIRDPQVSVNLDETVSQVVTVDGQVTRPGLYPVVGKMTLVRAVATAGGTAEYAKLDDVVVFRTVDGQRLAGLYNLKAIRRGAYADPEIFANDVIVVGDSSARRTFEKLVQAGQLLSSPLILLLTQ